jgi:hypothetical protein
MNAANLKIALWMAAARGHITIVERLLQAKAGIYVIEETNEPLQAAIEGGHLTVVKRLL